MPGIGLLIGRWTRVSGQFWPPLPESGTRSAQRHGSGSISVHLVLLRRRNRGRYSVAPNGVRRSTPSERPARLPELSGGGDGTRTHEPLDCQACAHRSNFGPRTCDGAGIKRPTVINARRIRRGPAPSISRPVGPSVGPWFPLIVPTGNVDPLDSTRPNGCCLSGTRRQRDRCYPTDPSEPQTFGGFLARIFSHSEARLDSVGR